MMIRFKVPTGTPAGPRMRLARRRNNGVLVQSRMVTPLKVISSSKAPSTLSSAKPRQPSKTQFEMVMFLNPPFDSVPHLMRPVGATLKSAGQRLKRAVQHGPQHVGAGNIAVGNRHILGRTRVAKRK